MGESWAGLAACRPLAPSVFYPKDLAGVIKAKRVCRDCPVIDACLEHAVSHGELGVWGGTSEEERERLHKARRQGFMEYHRVLHEVRSALGRALSGHPDERPMEPAKTCERCGANVKAGRWPPDRNGPGATCGKPATYNKGCRCDWCRAAKSLYQSKRP